MHVVDQIVTHDHAQRMQQACAGIDVPRCRARM